MRATATIPRALLARVRADQVATLYDRWHRTTASMLFGALIFCAVLRDHVSAAMIAAWIVAIVVNQASRGMLARAYRRAQPEATAAPRWGRRWAVGSAIAGALWGGAAVAMVPSSPPHEALVIVCLFGVVLGGLNLTAVYKPSFYGFALPALVPLIVRVALDGDAVHLYTAMVMVVVLAFLLAFGHQLNDVLTRSLAIRYENWDLIDELKAQTRLADAARVAAEAANRAKSQFLAAASHDLRQPLHAMGLFTAAIAARAKGPGVRPLVASMHQSIEALEGLFAQLLDLSRLEAGALHPERRCVALDPLFARLAIDFAPPAAAKNIALGVHATRLAVDSDPVLLERILRNLLANAVRYTRAGRIVVGARRRGACVRIDVLDTGVGIAAADRERIFDEFIRVGDFAEHDASGRGMGLGLAIVRRLARLLEHRLDLESTPDRGSRFSITLPRSAIRAAPAERPVCSARGDGLRGARVLVIDDDPAIVEAMGALYASWGARVAGAADAVAAEQAARRSGGIDLVVADLRLSRSASGVDAVHRLRAEFGAALAALIVSGDTAEAARAEVAAAGLPMLAKPVIAERLRAASATVIANASTSRNRPSRPARGATAQLPDGASAG